MKIIYLADTRIPSEKAHPYQIVQMCEAFAQRGADVTLIAPKRHNQPDYAIDNVAEFYSVADVFTFERLPCIDLFPLAQRLSGRVAKAIDWVAARLVTLTFVLMVIRRLWSEDDAIIYSRHPIVLNALAVVFPKRAERLFFEAHTYPHTATGERIRRSLMRRIGGFIVITNHLHERYETFGVPSHKLLVAHDAIRADRFRFEADRTACRQRVGWPIDTFIVGYMGRFQTLGMDKGIRDLAEAVLMLAEVDDLRLGLVGGPDESVDSLRAFLSPHQEMILYAGHVAPADVPFYLRAFDVCVMPFPWTEHFAYYASPMKLFEYMASGSPLVATDLPSTTEIVTHGHTALIVPPSDPAALASALRTLHDQPQQGGQLAQQAQREVFEQHTWAARAARIMVFMREAA